MDTIVKIIPPEERDPYGQYSIQNGYTHVLPFTIPLLGRVEFILAHILPNSQDFSLDMWITTKPLDGLVLQVGFGHFKPLRRADKYVIYDQFLKTDKDDPRLFLESGKTYYMNVKDLQNRKNAYQCEIHEIPPGPPVPPPPPPPCPPCEHCQSEP